MSDAFSSDDVRELLQVAIKALKKAGANDGRANLNGGKKREMRFARNGITTNGSVRQMKLTLKASVGKRTATVASNRIDPESITRLAEEAVANARVLPENREHMPSLGPQTYDKVEAWFPETAEMEPLELAAIAGKVIKSARDHDVTAAGFAAAGDWMDSLATFNGAEAIQNYSRAKLTSTVRTPDGTGSGWANSYARRLTHFKVDDVADGAIDRALRSRNPEALEPGNYPVILEPQAVANIVGTLRWGMSARSADEGRSFFSAPGGKNKIGTRIWDTPLSFRTDPSDPRTLYSTFNGNGLPRRRVEWVKDGVLRELPYTRYWAQKTGRIPVPWPTSWLLEGTGPTTSLQDMIANAERAILITRLWYIRMVDRRQLLVTGLTRDGTFLVENGKITKPLKNFRFNESAASVLQHTTKFSEPEIIGSGIAAPALSVSNFRFTSVSEAV